MMGGRTDPPRAAVPSIARKLGVGRGKNKDFASGSALATFAALLCRGIFQNFAVAQRLRRHCARYEKGRVPALVAWTTDRPTVPAEVPDRDRDRPVPRNPRPRATLDRRTALARRNRAAAVRRAGPIL